MKPSCRLIAALAFVAVVGVGLAGCSSVGTDIPRPRYGTYQNRIIIDGPTRVLMLSRDGSYKARSFEVFGETGSLTPSTKKRVGIGSFTIASVSIRMVEPLRMRK